MSMGFSLKDLVKKDIVKGLNLKSLVKEGIKSAKEGAIEKASQMVATNPEIQAKAGKAIEKQAVAGIAAKIADFYSKNKVMVFAGIGVIVLGTSYFFIRGLIARRK